MDSVFQILGIVLVAVILGAMLTRYGKDVSLLLTLAVCCMVLLAAVNSAASLIGWLKELAENCGLAAEWMSVLLKVVGIGLVSQMAQLICQDAGFGAMGKAVEIFSTVAALLISVPLMQALLALVEGLAGGI